MAGRPKRRAMIEELERLTKDYFDEETSTHTHLDYVAAQTENGLTLTELAENITGRVQTEISREMLSTYLRSAFSDTEARLTEARAFASHTLVEQAIKYVDAPAYSTVAVSRAASRARARQWTAERWNAREMGQNKQAGVTFNIGALHLSALRMTNTELTNALTPNALIADSASGPRITGARVSLDAGVADGRVDGAGL